MVVSEASAKVLLAHLDTSHALCKQFLQASAVYSRT